MGEGRVALHRGDLACEVPEGAKLIVDGAKPGAGTQELAARAVLRSDAALERHGRPGVAADVIRAMIGDGARKLVVRGFEATGGLPGDATVAAAATASSRTYGSVLGLCSSDCSAGAASGAPRRPNERMASMALARSAPVATAMSVGTTDGSFSAPSPLAANARV